MKKDCFLFGIISMENQREYFTLNDSLILWNNFLDIYEYQKNLIISKACWMYAPEVAKFLKCKWVHFCIFLKSTHN